MNGTRSHRHHRQAPRRESPGGPLYWGWSPESGRMEMMDLRNYLDSMRAGYDRALEDLYGRMTAVSDLLTAGQPMGYSGPGRTRGRHGHEDDYQWRRGWRGDHECDGCDDDHDDDCCPDHGHHHRHDRDGKGRHGRHRFEHGCGHHHDCQCECCIADADIVVYARCGELRVVPLSIENDTRKARENVAVDVSEFRTGGGRPLPWKALLQPSGAITLEGCSTTRLELLVLVSCPGTESNVTGQVALVQGDAPLPGGTEPPSAPPPPVEPIGSGPAPDVLRLAANQRGGGDVDSCEVGYATIRLEGCVVRPIVVAVAVLPNDCGSFHTRCSCSCC